MNSSDGNCYQFSGDRIFFLGGGLFLAALAFLCCMWAFSSCGYLVAEHGLRSSGSVVVEHGLSCSVTCRIFLDQASDLGPMRWQVNA